MDCLPHALRVFLRRCSLPLHHMCSKWRRRFHAGAWMFGHQPRALSWALHDRPRLLLRKINNPEQKSKWKRKLYFAQTQLVPRGSIWFHIVWNTFCAVRTKDVGYGSVVPCKNNIHYKSSVGGRWSTSYTTASETGGTVEPVASTHPGSPLLDRVWSGSN